jgi:hypothetical protein
LDLDLSKQAAIELGIKKKAFQNLSAQKFNVEHELSDLSCGIIKKKF